MRLLVLVVCSGLACGADTAPTGLWNAAEDGDTAPFPEAQAACGPLLVRAQVAALTGAPDDAALRVRAPYDRCMNQQGWVLAEDADPERAPRMREEIDAFLDREVAGRSTRRDFTRAFGDPVCEPGPPGRDVCVWEVDYASRVAGRSYPSVLTCLLPADGAPRNPGSCQFDAK